jgi:hypothetical protein
VARAIYVDEGETELWRSERAEHMPPGTMIPGPDGTRYLVVRVTATQDLGGPQERVLTFTLRPMTS